MYLPAVLAFTALDLAALLQYLSERGVVARSVILVPGRSLAVFAAVFAVLAPLVAVLRVFDFMVPPGLRASIDQDADAGVVHPAGTGAADTATGRTRSGMTGTALIVRRPRDRRRNPFRAYRVEVDGQEVGTVANGRELAVDVRPGVHLVRAVIDWTGSPEVRVSLEPGTAVTLVVTPVPGNPLDNIGRPDGYLHLAVQA